MAISFTFKMVLSMILLFMSLGHYAWQGRVNNWNASVVLSLVWNALLGYVLVQIWT